MKRPFLRRRSRTAILRTALLLALLPGAAGVLLVRWPPVQSLESEALDVLFLLRGPRPAPAGVCVVALDEDSYSVLGLDPAAPWPRRLHADLIRALAAGGARAIAFDVLFEEARDPDQDHALEKAIREAGMVVLGSRVVLVEDPRFRQARLIEPYEPFAAGAAAVADVGFLRDRDEVIRKAWLVHEDRPSLALAAYEVATKDRSRRDSGSRLIDYYGPARHVRTVSYYQALDPRQYLPEGFFRGKIVFVGLSEAAAAGPAAKDAFLTPFRAGSGESTFGVEIHATVAANLIENRHLDLSPPLLEAGGLLLLPLAAAILFLALRPLLGVFALLLLEGLPWAAGYFALSRGCVWIPVVLPAFQLSAVYVLCLIWYYLTTIRDRERIKRAFSFYLSPEMIQRISADPSALHLGGEEVVGTAMFTDIKGFTPLAEGLTAPQTAAMLNAYFSGVTGHIFASGGTLIKYIGDAVFAIWGAPLPAEDHATRACGAALALARDANSAGSGRTPSAPLFTRIGLHSGPMLVGNLGSAQRFDYTAIGDTVNLASRLEGLNKAFGTQALVSGETLSRAGERFKVRPLGKARVVGRSEPVEIFELLGVGEEPSPLSPALIDRFARALAAFSARRFAEAAEGFREVSAARAGADGPSEFYRKLIDSFAADPPPPDWDGVVHFETK